VPKSAKGRFASRRLGNLFSNFLRDWDTDTSASPLTNAHSKKLENHDAAIALHMRCCQRIGSRLPWKQAITVSASSDSITNINA